VATSSLTVARAMRKLQSALADLEQQRTFEDNVRARAEALLKHAAGIPVALLIANNSGRYIDVNDHATGLTGFSRTQLLRMSIWDLTPGASVAAGRRMWAEFLQAGQMTGTYLLCRRDGSQIRVDFRAWANVLPGVHVSALATPGRVRRDARGRRATR